MRRAGRFLRLSCLGLPLGFLAITLILPLLSGVILSFQADGFSLENYRFVLGDSLFRRSVYNTLILAAASLVVEFVWGLIFALLLSSRRRASFVTEVSVLMPLLIPEIVFLSVARYILLPRVAEFGAAQAYQISELDRVLPRYLEGVAEVYYPLGINEKFDQKVLKLLREAQSLRERLGEGPRALLDPRAIVHEMRIIKSPRELAIMRRSAAIAAEAHRVAISKSRLGMMEWEIQALVEYVFRVNGASSPAYPPIVASGPNATILHYIANNRELKPGDLLLLDAGCEYQFYASDITRTFPVSGRFTPCQRDLYEIVLAAQRAAIETVRPGVTLEDVHRSALKELVEGMRAMGLIKGETDEILASGEYKRFYMHRTSHWLGMDVHDVGRYRIRGEPRKLEPGMVLTVEPGIYIAPAEESVAKAELQGIGIRIEDDVLVSADGYEVLTAAVPKTVKELEALAGS